MGLSLWRLPRMQGLWWLPGLPLWRLRWLRILLRIVGHLPPLLIQGVLRLN